MLELAIGALLISLLAGILGVASAAGTIAKLVFVLFLIVAVVLFLMLLAGVNLLAEVLTLNTRTPSPATVR